MTEVNGHTEKTLSEALGLTEDQERERRDHLSESLRMIRRNEHQAWIAARNARLGDA